MIMEGEFQVRAPLGRTWGFLLNIREVAACIPSCQKVESADEKTFTLTFHQKLGPISATFETQTAYREVEPLKRITAAGKGRDLLMGSSFEYVNCLDLVEVGANETLVKYQADVKISGRLASMGQSLIRMVAKKEVEKTFQAIQSKIAEEAA